MPPDKNKEPSVSADVVGGGKDHSCVVVTNESPPAAHATEPEAPFPLIVSLAEAKSLTSVQTDPFQDSVCAVAPGN